ncbi:unnamed protein product [Ilex paraguariensis]|uniref:BHLH domain-containing protein n=1 Tax=Ilex paraguariensis TaxID=185542 RepID=A0ABC8V036_9AQUA
MADEFRSGVCGGSWFNPLRTTFGSSPCSSSIGEIGSFGWSSSDLVDMKVIRSCNESGPVSDGSVLFQDMQKSQQSSPIGCDGNIALNSTIEMMSIGLSSSIAADWNQPLLGGGRIENNYHPMSQEDLNSSLNYHEETGEDCPQIQKAFEPMNGGFSLDQQQPLNSITSPVENSATCRGLSTSFPLSSTSYGYPSTMLQTIFDTDSQPQESFFDNQSMNYSSTTDFLTNMNDFLPSLPKFSSLLKPSLPKQQLSSHLQSSNITNFWNNASASALNDIRANLLASTQSHLLTSTFNLSAKLHNEDFQEPGSVSTKTSSEPAFKRPRIETPSPLPTFKVRKEKLGDRITALQQLVSPFGKTDTASVLHEAIEYIKFLHDQVGVLSTPYIKNGAAVQRQQIPDKMKDQEEPKQDLRSRGLCLVPISSTFPVATETTADFWTPTFGGTFR